MWILVGLIFLYLYSKANFVCGVSAGLSKLQQSVQQPPCCTISTTCRYFGPIQHRTPQIMAPTNVPVPIGQFTYDDGQNIGIATANAKHIQFLDGLRNVVAEFNLSLGDTVTFNYGTLLANSYPSCGCNLACGSVDIFIAGVILQGPGGSMYFRNPYYTTASPLQQNGKLNLCGGCSPSLYAPGYAFQDKRSPTISSPVPAMSAPDLPALACGYMGPLQVTSAPDLPVPPVQKGSLLNLPSASAIISPGNTPSAQGT